VIGRGHGARGDSGVKEMMWTRARLSEGGGIWEGKGERSYRRALKEPGGDRDGSRWGTCRGHSSSVCSLSSLGALNPVLSSHKEAMC
jgi:hypothetical protein